MYADNTIVYYVASDVKIIERKMNEDFKYIAQYLDDTELVINLKKGKTESMLLVRRKDYQRSTILMYFIVSTS